MAWRADGRCKSFLCVLVFFVAVCSFGHCTEPARSQTSNSSVKLKGHGTFSQNHSKDSSGRLIIGRSPLKGAILKEVKLANNPLDVDTDYQSDPAWEAPAHVYGTASYDSASAQKLLQMNPKVECTPEFMKLMVLDPGSTPGSLFVDRGSLLAPLPLSKLPISCGYSYTSARRHLILVAPYDGCFVTQEDDCYVLPLQWCGLPVRMSCPAVRQSNPPVVSCRAEGMVVTMEWIVSISDIKVKLNDQWEPLMKVSSACGFSVVAHSEGVVISARYAPCVQIKDGMFTFGLSGDGEITVACPPQLKPAQSPNQQVPSSPWSLHPVPPTLAPPMILTPSAQVPIYPQYPWVPGHPFQTAVPTTSMPPSKGQEREPFNQFPLYPWLLQPPVTKPYKTHQVDQPFYQYPSEPAILSPVTHAPRGPEQQPIYPYPLYTQQPTYEYEYPPGQVQEPNYQYPVYPPSEPIRPTEEPFYQYPTMVPPGQEPSYQYPLYPPSEPAQHLQPPDGQFQQPGQMQFDFSDEPTTGPPVTTPPEISPEPTTGPPATTPPKTSPAPTTGPPATTPPETSPEPTTGPPVTTPPEMPFYFPQTPPVNENPGEMYFDFSPKFTTEPPVINPPEMHGPPVTTPPQMPFYFPQTTPVNENPGEMYFDFSPEFTTGPPVTTPPEMPFFFPQTPPVNENHGEMQFDFSPEPTTEPPVINPPEMHGDFSQPSQPPQITADCPQSGITYNSPVLCPENCISGFSYCCPSISFHQHYHYHVPAGLQLNTLACQPEMQQHYVQLEPVVPTASYPDKFTEPKPPVQHHVGGSQHEAPPYQPQAAVNAIVNAIMNLYGESSDVNDHTETNPIYYNTYDQQRDYFVQNEEPVEDPTSYMQDFGGLPTSDNNDPSKTHEPVHRHKKSSKHEHPVDSNSEPDGYEGGKDKLFKSQPRASYSVPLPNEDDQLPINQELTESASLDYPVPNGQKSPTVTPKPSLSPSNTTLKPEPTESLKDERKSKTQFGLSPSVPPQVSGQPSQTQD